MSVRATWGCDYCPVIIDADLDTSDTRPPEGWVEAALSLKFTANALPRFRVVRAHYCSPECARLGLTRQAENVTAASPTEAPLDLPAVTGPTERERVR